MSVSELGGVTCPSLDPTGRGVLVCSQSSKLEQHRQGSKCFLKCPPRYQLHGEYELTCRSDGTWDGPKHGECVSECNLHFPLWGKVSLRRKIHIKPNLQWSQFVAKTSRESCRMENWVFISYSTSKNINKHNWDMWIDCMFFDKTRRRRNELRSLSIGN